MIPAPTDDNLVFSFVWKPKRDLPIDFWVLHDGDMYHGFFRRYGEIKHCAGNDAANLLFAAIIAAGLSNEDSHRIFCWLEKEIRKQFH